MQQTTLHNPDRYMIELRQILSQGRKRTGFLIGAGAPASILVDSKNEVGENGKPLIPDIASLTKQVIDSLEEADQRIIESLISNIDGKSIGIETILTRIRKLAEAIGEERIRGLSGSDYSKLASRICNMIGSFVSISLPNRSSAYLEFVKWIGGTHREFPVEIFTTNYDLLFEQAFEKSHLPFFDGFSGSSEPFFDSTSINDNALSPRWSRLWKLHGSLGWDLKDSTIVRTGNRKTTSLIYPEHLKYEQTEKQPYIALFQRLKTFLGIPDSLLICTGFSFSDAHIVATLDEGLASNAHTAIIAFQFNTLNQETGATQLAKKRSNMSVYARDGAVINRISGNWELAPEHSVEWGTMRSTFWHSDEEQNHRFLLGDFVKLARFLTLTHSEHLSVGTQDQLNEECSGSNPDGARG